MHRGHRFTPILLLYCVAWTSMPARAARWWGPTPYVQASNSPFKALGNKYFEYFFLETYESGQLATPGVSASEFVRGSSFIGPDPKKPRAYVDSVDGDDGSIDGSGNGGESHWAHPGLTFTFDAGALPGGRLPTHVGVVWTDGRRNAQCQATDARGRVHYSKPHGLDDGDFFGGTGEDRFFGVTSGRGIKSFTVSCGGDGLEVDHFQYGFHPLPTNQVRAVEVVQSVQDWNNSVPLIAGKRTFVRVFLEAPRRRVAPELTLIGTRMSSGQALGSIVNKPAGPAGVEITRDAAAQRAKRDGAVLFELPEPWVASAGDVRLELDSEECVLEAVKNPPLGLERDGSITVTFRPGVMPRIYVVPIATRARDDDGLKPVLCPDPADPSLRCPSSADILRELNVIQNVFPVPGLSIQHLPTYALKDSAVAGVHDLIDRVLPYRVRPRQSEIGGTPPASFFLGFIERDEDYGTADRSTRSAVAAMVPGSTGLVGVHEFGHLLSLEHTVHRGFAAGRSCPPGVAAALRSGWLTGSCCEVGTADAPDFPFFIPAHGHLHPALGPTDPSSGNGVVFGFNPAGEEPLDPTLTADVMSYCARCAQFTTLCDRSTWLSATNYVRAFEFLAALGATQPGLRSASLAAAGTPGPVAGFQVVASVSGDQLLSLRCRELDEVPTSPAPAADYRVVLKSPAGTVLFDLPVEARWDSEWGAVQIVDAVVAKPSEPVGRIEILHRGSLIGSMSAGARSPIFINPVRFDGIELGWNALDLDGDPLTYDVLYTRDDGRHWIPWFSGVTTNQIAVAADDSLIESLLGPGLGEVRYRVIASDGIHATAADSPPEWAVAFPLPTPKVAIVQPARGATVQYGEDLVLQVAVIRTIGPGGTEASMNTPYVPIAWSSDRAGRLGSLPRLRIPASSLAAGTHRITVTVGNRPAGAVVPEDSVTIQIDSGRVLEIVDIERVEESGILEIIGRATRGSTVILESSNGLAGWESVDELESGHGGVQFDVGLDPALPHRFYRLRLRGP